MKKNIFIFLSFLCITNLSANENKIDYTNYKKYVTYTNDISIDNIKSKKDIFLGSAEEYKSSNELDKSIISNNALNGLLTGINNGATSFAKGLMNEGLKAGITGLGIGLIFGSIDSYKKTKEEKDVNESMLSSINTPYYLVEDIENNESQTTRKITMVVFGNLYNSDKEFADMKKIEMVLRGEAK